MNNEKLKHPRAADATSCEASVAPRRPYQAPRILERQAIEAVAAVCTVPGGKNDPTCLVGFS